MIVALVLIGIVVLLALWAVLTYNGLVRLRNRFGNAWSQIDVQLRRRYDLIPNLVETVKGYARHEREAFATEDRIRFARQLHNDSVLAYDNRRQSFPANVVAGTFDFDDRDYFEIDEELRGPVEVEL